MREPAATLPLLIDAITSLQRFVDVFVGVYTLLIFAYILTSWIRLPYSVWLNRIQRFLYDVCEPFLRIFRRILPPLGPLVRGGRRSHCARGGTAARAPGNAGFPRWAAPQAWLKKPPRSRSRARSSAETSTFRGVSRKTLSATRCIPPSSA